MANKKARPAPMTNEKALGILMELYQAEGKKMLTDTDDPNLMSALDRGICALDDAGKQSEAERKIEAAIAYCQSELSRLYEQTIFDPTNGETYCHHLRRNKSSEEFRDEILKILKGEKT